MTIHKSFKLILSIALFGLSSCYSHYFRTYEDGQLRHRETPVRYEPYWKSTNDSVVILDRNDTFQITSGLIEKAEIKYPNALNMGIVKYPKYSQSYTLLEYAKDEAKRIGANCIKIIAIGEIDKLPFDRFHLVAVFYKLNESDFTILKTRQDSAFHVGNDFQIVHIKNFTKDNVDIPLYFNDTLIGNFSHFRKKNKPANDDLLEFKIYGPGKLTTNYNRDADILLQPGKDIYIHIKNTKHGYYLRFVTKYDYLFTSINS